MGSIVNVPARRTFQTAGARERSRVFPGRCKRRCGAAEIRQIARFYKGRKRKGVDESGETLTNPVHARAIEVIRMVGEFEKQSSPGNVLGHIESQRHGLATPQDERE